MTEYVHFKSQFIEMFGDNKWSKVKLQEHAEVIVGYPLSSAKYSEHGTKIVGGYNIMPGNVVWEESKHWPDVIGYEEYLLQEGDIVMAMDRPWVGEGFKMAVIDRNNLPAILIQRTACIRVKDIECLFLYAALNTKNFAEHCNIKGSVVPHISNSDINSFMIPFPPRDLQQKFVSIAEQADKSAFEGFPSSKVYLNNNTTT